MRSMHHESAVRVLSFRRVRHRRSFGKNGISGSTDLFCKIIRSRSESKMCVSHTAYWTKDIINTASPDDPTIHSGGLHRIPRGGQIVHERGRTGPQDRGISEDIRQVLHLGPGDREQSDPIPLDDIDGCWRTSSSTSSYTATARSRSMAWANMRWISSQTPWVHHRTTRHP